MFWRTGIGLWSLCLYLACSCTQVESQAAGGVFVGCFAKNPEELPFFWWPFSSQNTTLGRCYVACQNAFFSYAAISGMRCYCGNSGHDLYGEASSCFDCVVEKQKFKCAPDAAMGVYQTEIQSRDNRYMGCWYGNPTLIGSAVEKPLIGYSSDLTVDKCINKCRKKFLQETEFNSNTIYIAIRGGKQCFCGRDLKSEREHLKGMTPAISGCDFPCTGNASQLCGGEMQSNFYSIYRAVCSNGYFGLDCRPCNCSPGFTCDKTTGQCYSLCDDCHSDCKDGFFGESCTPCNCPDDPVCHKITGMCSNQRCGKGWRQDQDGVCSISCSGDRYGQDCSQACNCLSSFKCDPVTGKCPFQACSAGFYGATCSAPCPPDRYGKDCRRKCACQYCDSMTGLCVENCIEGAPCRLRSTATGSGSALPTVSLALIVIKLAVVFAMF